MRASYRCRYIKHTLGICLNVGLLDVAVSKTKGKQLNKVKEKEQHIDMNTQPKRNFIKKSAHTRH